MPFEKPEITDIPKKRQDFLKDKYECFFDFYKFCNKCLGFKDIEQNKFYPELCRFLLNDNNQKLILMPRYTFKSSIGTVAYILWRLVHNPNEAILIYSDAATKSVGFLNSVKAHIIGNVENSRFREMFGKWETDPKKGKWSESQIIIAPRKTGRPEPSVDTGGVGTTKVGFHYDCIIFDDLVSDVNVTTKEQMDKVEDCYRRSLSLLRPGGDVIMLGTRWNFGDLYGRIIAEQDIKGNFGIFIKKAEENGTYFFDNIGENSLTKEFLSQQRSVQGTYIYSCNPYESLILMDNWKSKPIGEIKEDEIVIGWNRRDTGRKQLVKSKVLKVQSRIADVVKITLESGRTIRCTPDHHWYTGRLDESHREYKPAAVGSKLMYMFEPKMRDLSVNQYEAATWLGGFYDGEGSCTDSIILNQSRVKNPEVCRKLETVLATLDYKWNSAEKVPSRTALGGKTVYYWVNGGIEGKRRFILESNPARKHTIEKSMFKHGSSFVKEKDKVISIKPDGREKVYALQTETGNYIAHGYGSKNCLYQNEPTDPETSVFKVKDFAFYGDIKKDDLYITATCDPAGEGEDFTAITVVGTDNKMDMHIFEIVNKHLQPSDIINEIIRLNYRYGFKMLGIETNFFRGMLRLELERQIAKERITNPAFKLFGVHEFQASSRRGQGKVNRIMALQPYHERGAIRFPGEKYELLKGVFGELSWQMVQFPHSAHDDILDSLAYHLPLIQKGGVVKRKGIPRNTPAWLEKQSYNKELNKMACLPRRWRKPIDNLAFS